MTVRRGRFAEIIEDGGWLRLDRCFFFSCDWTHLFCVLLSAIASLVRSYCGLWRIGRPAAAKGEINRHPAVDPGHALLLMQNNPVI